MPLFVESLLLHTALFVRPREEMPRVVARLPTRAELAVIFAVRQRLHNDRATYSSPLRTTPQLPR